MNHWLVASLIGGLVCFSTSVTAYGYAGRGRTGASHATKVTKGAGAARSQSTAANAAFGQSGQKSHGKTPAAEPAKGLPQTAAGLADGRSTSAKRPSTTNGAAANPRKTSSGQKPGSHLSETQQQNVNKLLTDLKDIKSGSQVTPEQKTQFRNDLMAMADGATKPSQESVNQLAVDLQSFWSDQKLSPIEQKKLMTDVGTVLSSANIPTSEVQATIKDAQAILTTSGVTKQDAVTVVNDLKSIATELKGSLHAKPSDSQ